MPGAASETAPLPTEDFEAVEIGAIPAGWVLGEKNADISFAVALGGERAGRVLEAVVTDKGFGGLARSLDATPWRGRRLAVRAQARAAPDQWWSRGAIGFRVTRPDPSPWADAPRSNPIVEATWRPYVAIVDVASDATSIDVVVSAAGAGRVSVDDIVVTDLGPAGGEDAPPAALTGRALDNVVAFARLYGLVRYFHPSDEAAALDVGGWERFIVHGIRAVEPVEDAPALVAVLTELFAPLAPSVQLYLDGDTPAIAPRDEVEGAGKLRWHHDGLGISASSIYSSSRGAPGGRAAYASLTTSLDAASVRGKTIRIRARVKARLGEGGDVGIWALASRKDGSPTFFTEPEMLPDPGRDWTWIEASGEVAADTHAFVVGVQAIGTVDAWIEAPTVEVIDGPQSTPVPVPGWGRAGNVGPPWNRWGHLDEDVTMTVGRKGCAKRRPCVAVSAVAPPPPSEAPWQGPLVGGVSARVPVVVDTDGEHTIPAATIAAPDLGDAPRVATDRATRLAAVVVAWNIPQHFHPYLDDTNVDWPAELRTALGRAAVDGGPEALLHTLRRLYSALDDGHGYVMHDNEPESHRPPWAWRIVEGELVITRVSAACACDLRAGDVVTSIDGIAAADVVAGAREEVSAATPQFRDHLVANRLSQGGERSRTRIEVRRDGVVHAVEASYVEVQSIADDLEQGMRPADGMELAPGVRYLDLDRTDEARFVAVLPRLLEADVVIFDLRGYPGGAARLAIAHVVDHAVSSPQWRIPIVPHPDRVGMTFPRASWAIEPAGPRIKRAVFVTDGRAVSAAETYMGIVEGHRLGEIVGSPTAGTNGNINPFTVPGGYELWFTGMKVLKHDGSRHHGVGIQPTVPATPTIGGIAAGRDEVLEKAIEVARGGAAGAP